MVRLAMTTNTAMATIASVVVSPETWARPAAAPREDQVLRVHGGQHDGEPERLDRGHGLDGGEPLGHLAGAPGAGRFRQLRRARARSPTPRAILPHDTESAAVLLVATLPSCANT